MMTMPISYHYMYVIRDSSIAKHILDNFTFKDCFTKIGWGPSQKEASIEEEILFFHLSGWGTTIKLAKKNYDTTLPLQYLLTDS